MTVNALDALVHTVIVTLWTAALVAFIVGALALAARQHRLDTRRAYRGRHHKTIPARPPLTARIVAALAAGWRDLAHAQALATGGEPWPSA